MARGGNRFRIPEELGVLKEVDLVGAHQDRPREKEKEEAPEPFDANKA